MLKHNDYDCTGEHGTALRSDARRGRTARGHKTRSTASREHRASAGTAHKRNCPPAEGNATDVGGGGVPTPVSSDYTGEFGEHRRVRPGRGRNGAGPLAQWSRAAPRIPKTPPRNRAFLIVLIDFVHPKTLPKFISTTRNRVKTVPEVVQNVPKGSPKPDVSNRLYRFLLHPKTLPKSINTTRSRPKPDPEIVPAPPKRIPKPRHCNRVYRFERIQNVPKRIPNPGISNRVDRFLCIRKHSPNP